MLNNNTGQNSKDVMIIVFMTFLGILTFMEINKITLKNYIQCSVIQLY